MGNNYFLAKLTLINDLIARNGENAVSRLAEVSHQIIPLFVNDAPEQFREKYIELYNVIRAAHNDRQGPGIKLSTIDGIDNTKAAEYIKLLRDMQDFMDDQD